MEWATRPVLQGRLGMVAAGHHLPAAIGLQTLERGGNAVDAGVAAGFALALVKPQENGLGGEAPILVRSAAGQHAGRPPGGGAGGGTGGRTVAINGQGWAPGRATIDWFRREGIGASHPTGSSPPPCPAPSAARCASAAALRHGLPGRRAGAGDRPGRGRLPGGPRLRERIAGLAGRFRQEWPTSAAVYLPSGAPPTEGTLLRDPDWARTMKGALDASLRETGRGRRAAIRRQFYYFYRGPVAEQAVAFSETHAVQDAPAGPTGLSAQDWENYGARGTRLEAPLRATYRGVECCKCGP